MPPVEHQKTNPGSDQCALLSLRLHEACTHIRHREVVSLLAEGADPNASVAISAGALEVRLRPLQAVLAGVSTDEATPRMLRKLVVRIVVSLLDAGAVLPPVERDLLFGAVSHNVEELLDVLVKRGALVQRYGFELTAIALWNRSTTLLHALSRNGVDLNCHDAAFCTPFLNWCVAEHAEGRTIRGTDPAESLAKLVAQFRLCGVDVNLPDRLGATALMRALASGDLVQAKGLLLAGARVDVPMRNGVTAVHLAAVCGGSDFLRFMQELHLPLGSLSALELKGLLQPDARDFIRSLDLQRGSAPLRQR